MNNLIQYMKLHLISLEQDLQQLNDNRSNVWSESSDAEETYLNGQIYATKHLMSVASDMMSDYISGKEYK